MSLNICEKPQQQQLSTFNSSTPQCHIIINILLIQPSISPYNHYSRGGEPGSHSRSNLSWRFWSASALLRAVSWDLLDRGGRVATRSLISTLHAWLTSCNSMHSGVTSRGQANPCSLTLNRSMCWCVVLIITCHELNWAQWWLLNCCCLVRLQRFVPFHLFFLVVCIVCLSPQWFIPNINRHVFLPG